MYKCYFVNEYFFFIGGSGGYQVRLFQWMYIVGGVVGVVGDRADVLRKFGFFF